MSEELVIKSQTKNGRYNELYPQIKSLLEGESDLIANLGNFCAALKQTFGFFWLGFYLVKNDELVLGPFQGPVACTRIKNGKGVCGSSWQQKQTLIVPDVDQFPGHIACSSLSRSEIVVPLFDSKNEVWAVLDVDSDKLAAFDQDDEKQLKKLLTLIPPVS